MDMVVHTADQQRYQLVLARDAAQISPDAPLDIRTEPRFTVFGAEDEVILKAGEGVCHNVRGLFPIPLAEAGVSSVAPRRTPILTKRTVG
jgi:hypothetical protein